MLNLYVVELLRLLHTILVYCIQVLLGSYFLVGLEFHPPVVPSEVATIAYKFSLLIIVYTNKSLVMPSHRVCGSRHYSRNKGDALCD